MQVEVGEVSLLAAQNCNQFSYDLHLQTEHLLISSHVA